MAKRKGFEIERRTHRILCSSIFEGKKKKIVFRLSIGKKHYIFFLSMGRAFAWETLASSKNHFAKNHKVD
jgi:hypothetical protein